LQLCGDILTNRCFRDLINNVEVNCKTLNNYSLLLAASDLLYLRLTLKQATIPTLLSHVDFESMDLAGQRETLFRSLTQFVLSATYEMFPFKNGA